MAETGTPRTDGPVAERERPAQRHWRTLFIDHLAATSNVAESVAHSGISPARAYRARRNEAEFARQWLGALAEGYMHLKMGTGRCVREGDCLATN